jgi:4-hydroxymandelate oxidase
MHSDQERSVSLEQPLNLLDLERLARARLPRMAFDYFASGADDERTLSENRAAYGRIPLHYRVLRGVAERDLRVTVLGHELAFPVLVAPMAFQRLAHDDGELATVRAAGAAGTIMILSTLSTHSLEDVVAASSGPVWFQLYVYKDRQATQALVARAEAAGCEALVLTVDAPLLGRRERDVRNRFHLPQGLEIKNLLAAGHQDLSARAGDSGLSAYVASLLDPGLTFEDVAWLRSITSLPVLVKGVVRPEDAAQAIAHGASGVVVSNHGGRQLDTAPATIDVVAEVAAAVGTDGEVLLDGGVRRGTDVVKALARGARAVLLGRPVLWGLALEGQPGARRALDMLRDELDLALALCGCRDLREVTPDLLGAGPPGGQG